MGGVQTTQIPRRKGEEAMTASTEGFVETEERPNRRAFARSFAVAGIIVVAWVLAIMLWLGPPQSGYGLGLVMGRMLVPAVIGALVAGFSARRSRSTWGWGKYFLVVTAVALGLLLLLAVGRLSRGGG